MNTFLAADVETWEKLLGGSTGFILATLLFGTFYWKVVMPARAKETEQLTRLTDAVNALVLHYKEASQEKFDQIIEKLNAK